MAWAFYSSMLIFTFIAVISVVGVYALTGLTGMFSLGQAAFMAVGAYASSILVVRAGLPFPIAFALAVMIAVFVGFIVGLPTVRLRRDYIALVTFGFGEAINALLIQASRFTGGAMGFVGIPRRTTLTLAFVSAVVAIALVALFKTGKFGRQCIAIRSDELAAKAMGINVPRIKMSAFLLSVAVTAYSGCLFAFHTMFIDPTLFGWTRSADWIIMVFFGGINSLTGAVISTFVLSGLPELLRFLAGYRGIIYAVLVLIIINFKPRGLLGEWELSPRGIKNLLGKIPRKKGGAKHDS